ncbi:ATP-binding protein [Streptomyces ureilyticus]|uniref:ATP-binding protein n=1 Tax=Streptomyces ureilyticus TaxID=1775131 RepID=A0ABX0DX12_9ACTN|nr:ATP-binding protein [Streptomyces ureilyticus]NGO46465.1 ATP-binding protein [Streptomyces ureilyticus]
MTRRARIAVTGAPSAVAFARDRVIAHIQAWGVRLSEEEQDAIKLVASELITNAVVHATGFVTVGLYLNQERLLLVVHDCNPQPPRRQVTTEDDEGGRGLVLVEFLAARHGWQPTNNGKKVWAEFDVPVPASAVHGGVLRERMRAVAPRAYAHVMPERRALVPGL